jgi:hypothetical protein
MASGKWIHNDVKLCELADIGVVIETLEGHAAFLDKIQVRQPVGISFQIEHEKYIFDSTVLGFESAITAPGGRILIEMPDFMEKMPRRSYERQSVPSNLNVQVLFWHRGYSDNTICVPTESYWQGHLINLSASGAQISVPMTISNSFRSNQLVGLQFTPMFYQKPVLVEAQIIHLRPDQTEGKLCLGLEFLGLEVSMDGRTILHRLSEIVEEYAKLNSSSAQSNQHPVS